MALLGFQVDHDIMLVSREELQPALECLAGTAKETSGRGLQFGIVELQSESDHFKLALFTPQTRSWYGPVLQFTLKSRKGGGTVLRGRFRLTYTQVLASVLVQLGVLCSGAEFILTGEYRRNGVPLVSAILAVVIAVLATLALPKLVWITRRWKMKGIVDYLDRCGFVEASELLGSRLNIQQIGD